MSWGEAAQVRNQVAASCDTQRNTARRQGLRLRWADQSKGLTAHTADTPKTPNKSELLIASAWASTPLSTCLAEADVSSADLCSMRLP